MTDDIACKQPWDDFEDTPEARDAVTKMQEHYLPIIVELRQDVADRDQEIIDKNNEINQLQKKMEGWRTIAWALFGSGVVFALYGMFQ